jgi:FMN-dependent NADH-azoreductase
MKKVLIINASARMQNSQSRKLTEVFTEHWKSLYGDSAITFRDLAKANVPHITESWLNATLKPAKDRTEEDVDILSTSDTYIAELRQADIIVLGTPMYNWSIPSSLKAFVDQVLRHNETFTVNPGNAQQPYTGLLENKILCLLVARGGQSYESGQANAHLNFQTTYLKTVFNMMGIHNIHLVAVNGTAMDKEELKKSITTAHHAVKELIAQGLI